MVGGRWAATGGASTVYQNYGSSSLPGDCDADGFNRADDCDDGDPAVYPGAPELCDGRDNDCNGAVDEGPDTDADGVNDVCDNCRNLPNGPLGGSCVAGDPGLILSSCTLDAQCGGAWNQCSIAQDDHDLDGVGDACDPDTVPEPGLGLLLSIGALFLLIMTGEGKQRRV